MIKIFFENPVFLWYLLSIPILIISHFTFLKNARFKAIRFSNFDTIHRLTGVGPDQIITKNWSILLMRLLVLFFVILAITSPTIWYKNLSHDADFVIAIDTSASMLADDFEPNRLSAAKEQAKLFVKEIRGGSKIGLIDFAGSSFIDQILIDDKNLVIDKIDNLKPLVLGGTDLAGAIISGSNLLALSEKGRILVLMSDGSNTVDSFSRKSLDVALQYAQDSQIIINTIGIGSNKGNVGYLPEYYNVTAVYDSEQLKYIANMTEGQFYDGNNITSFSAAFEDILANPQETYISKDTKSILLLMALLILFLEWGMINTRYRRLP